MLSIVVLWQDRTAYGAEGSYPYHYQIMSEDSKGFQVFVCEFGADQFEAEVKAKELALAIWMKLMEWKPEIQGFPSAKGIIEAGDKETLSRKEDSRLVLCDTFLLKKEQPRQIWPRSPIGEVSIPQRPIIATAQLGSAGHWYDSPVGFVAFLVLVILSGLAYAELHGKR